jgi:DNA-binding NarL/FixJ family response regulator
MRYRIYLVEDHPSMRDAYALTIDAEPDLQICGTTSTAESALAEIAHSEPDLVLVDISLPGMDGFAFLSL